jgi:hypothetical protein
MSDEKQSNEKYVYVKDNNNNVFVCKLSDLKNPDELTEAEKEGCLKPPGDA